MASLRKAVDMMCKDCCYDKMVSGSWRKQVEQCTVTSCPLYEHRPVTIEARKNRIKLKEVA